MNMRLIERFMHLGNASLHGPKPFVTPNFCLTPRIQSVINPSQTSPCFYVYAVQVF